MATRDIEVRFTADDSAAGTFGGCAVAYGVRDSYGSVFLPGVFAASLAQHRKAGTRPLLLWQHNPDEPIGVWEEVREDARGLAVKGRLILDTTRGREAHALLKAGALNGLSIGFRAQTAKALADGTRAITKAELIEISLAAFPANPAARVTGIRSTGDDLAALFRRAAAQIRR